ncbi:MAG: hypothetical protein AABX23_01675 [Nanoarchaeota archaeon]
MLVKPAKELKFIEQDIEDNFLSLPNNSLIKKGIQRAITKLKENVFAGENIRKERIPKEYIQKYLIDNLWWYPLPDAWRLVYSIATSKSEVLVTIIEYFDHKNYAKRFGYKS